MWLRLILPFLFVALAALPGDVLAAPNQPTVRRYSLNMSEQVVWADGNPVPGIVFNGSFPGPTIRARVGEILLVNVTNLCLDRNITVHWHGLSQRMTPRSDGTPKVSQWPVAPRGWFEYEIHPTAEDMGTYFYHSHVELQATTAYGALIIEGAIPDVYDLKPKPKDKVLMIGDYFHKSAQEMAAGLLGDPFVWPGSASALLLNGNTFASCNETIAGARKLKCEDMPTKQGPEVVRIGYGQTLRLRLIGAQTLMYTAFGILKHRPTLIASDGTYLVPKQVEHIEISSGQRYDAFLWGKSQREVERDGDRGCYWIRLESRWRKPPTNGWGLLAYPSCQIDKALVNIKALNSTQDLLPPAQFGWIAGELEPLPWEKEVKMPSDEEVSQRFIIEGQQIGWFPSANGTRWAVDGQVYDEKDATPVPYLVQLYLNESTAPSYERAMKPTLGVRKGFDAVANSWVLRAGEVVDFVIINNSSAKTHTVEHHPWHQHGPKHWTLASGMGNFSDEALAKVRAKGYKRPVARDTSDVWPGPADSALPASSSGGWTVLRFKATADAAGIWLLHCHWGFHALMGMATIYTIDPERALQASGLAIDPGYLEFGHNVASPWTVAHAGISE